MRTLTKVMAYITRLDRDGARELLIFRQPTHPEAGPQVPGGTIEADESPADAVLREAHEETGLRELELVRFLGLQSRDMRDHGRDEIHHRHFFELSIRDAPDAWQWTELHPSEGGAPILFELFWVPVTTVPPLISEHDHFVKALLARRKG